MPRTLVLSILGSCIMSLMPRPENIVGSSCAFDARLARFCTRVTALPAWFKPEGSRKKEVNKEGRYIAMSNALVSLSSVVRASAEPQGGPTRPYDGWCGEASSASLN